MKNKQANTLDSTSLDKNKKKKDNSSIIPGLIASLLGLAGGGAAGAYAYQNYLKDPLNEIAKPGTFGWDPRGEYLSHTIDKVKSFIANHPDKESDIRSAYPVIDKALIYSKYTPQSAIKTYDWLNDKLNKNFQPKWHMNMGKVIEKSPLLVPAATGVLGAGLAYLVARNIQKRLANKKKKENQENLVDE